jgi:hypothetical protein
MNKGDFFFFIVILLIIVALVFVVVNIHTLFPTPEPQAFAQSLVPAS